MSCHYTRRGTRELTCSNVMGRDQAPTTSRGETLCTSTGCLLPLTCTPNNIKWIDCLMHCCQRMLNFNSCLYESESIVSPSFIRDCLQDMCAFKLRAAHKNCTAHCKTCFMSGSKKASVLQAMTQAHALQLYHYLTTNCKLEQQFVRIIAHLELKSSFLSQSKCLTFKGLSLAYAAAAPARL